MAVCSFGGVGAVELGKADDFRIYYGKPSGAVLKKMAAYDVLVLEPSYYSAEQVRTIKKGGSKVFGYLSSTEVNQADRKMIDALNPDDYVYKNGKKVYFKEWGSYLIDISKPHTQEALRKRVREIADTKEFDGIFIDTVGNIEEQPAVSFAKEAMQDGYIDFLKKVKEEKPGVLLMQNRGFDTMRAGADRYVDAFLYEDFRAVYAAKDAWSIGQIRYIQSLEEKGRMAAFSTVPDKASARVSREAGFVPMIHRGFVYNKW